MSQPVARAARGVIASGRERLALRPFRLVSVSVAEEWAWFTSLIDGWRGYPASGREVDAAGMERGHRERFLQEREILAALTHPNIAHLLDAGQLDDGQPYLAMEYVEGKPIDQILNGFGVRQKIELFLKVCRAVAYLHRESGIAPGLEAEQHSGLALGEPKILDFGIAKMMEPGGDPTATHLRMLTPDYASPEQMNGGVVGKSSDIYSLGAVLHRLITGKPPRETRPSQLSPELKGDLELVLQTALRQEPEER